MRDKLIELIESSRYWGAGTSAEIADHLIANNVFVLPDELENNLELTAKFLMGLFLNSEEEIEKTKEIFEFSQTKKILTDIRDYLVAILDEWHRRSDEPNFYEQNIGVYNHIRKELDDLAEYAEKLGVEI